MNWKRWGIVIGAFLAVIPLACLPPSALTPDLGMYDDGECNLDPSTPVNVHKLAKEVDFLERRVECFGSITLKRADVWGQARLMRHRHEFEREMQKDLDQFKDTLSGWVSRRDQAFLANAFTLQAAFAGGTVEKAATVQTSNQALITTKDDAIKRDTILSGTAHPGFGSSGVGATQTTLSISIEPTLHLSQKSRYLNHLHELRRINEGDDNADSPGYALNLVRLPVSILTGSHTQEGYGAEVALTASPHLTDDLLPMTFRNLVVQDLVDLATVPVSHAIGAFEQQRVEQLAKLLSELDEKARAVLIAERRDGKEMTLGDLRDLVARYARRLQPPVSSAPLEAGQHFTGEKVLRMLTSQESQKSKDGAPKSAPPGEPLPPPRSAIFKTAKELTPTHGELIAAYLNILEGIRKDLGSSAVNIPTRQRVSPLPIPPSQLVDVFGPVAAARVITTVHRAVRSHLASGRPYHLDVQAALSDELQAAYEFLLTPQHRPLWDRFCTPALAQAVRSHDHEPVERMYAEFLTQVSLAYPQDLSNPDRFYSGDEVAQKPVTVFAWAILVETALLEERLTDDMKAVKTLKGFPDVPSGLHFHGPEPSSEARRIFNDYVRARWPVYVFAIDPVTEDQNIADDFSMRREMQLAVALAFSSGQLSASNMTKFIRRIEKDMNTVALNRTVIGFSHGDNVFGWRFYPRVQSPPIRGNLATLSELIAPGNDLRRDLNHRRLENGQRECIALMIMPSFVPYLDLEATTHWFKLNNPKSREGTTTDALRLGRRVNALRALAPKCPDAKQYRPEDVAMIRTKLEQLAARLPLQQQTVNVPYENTAGGFELFSTGVTDLAPQLVGWYGAPGLKSDGETTMFLVGDNFSVHDTKVVIGGTLIDDTKTTVLNVTESREGVVKGDLVTVAPRVDLLSRQIMRVTVPRGALPYPTGSTGKCVADIHIATPYGVSQHIAIPIAIGCMPAAVKPPEPMKQPEPAPPPEHRPIQSPSRREGPKLDVIPTRHEVPMNKSEPDVPLVPPPTEEPKLPILNPPDPWAAPKR